MKKQIFAGVGVVSLALSLSACGPRGYSERDLCRDGRQHFNSAPAIGADHIETASFVVPVGYGGGFSGGRSGGFSSGRSGGFSSGRSGGFSSGSSGGSKSWGWGSKSSSNSGSKSSWSWGSKSKSNSGSGLTGIKGFSGSKPSWTNKTGSIVKDNKGKLFFNSKPRYVDHGVTYRNGHAYPYFIYMGDDGSRYPIYCNN